MRMFLNWQRERFLRNELGIRICTFDGVLLWSWSLWRDATDADVQSLVQEAFQLVILRSNAGAYFCTCHALTSGESRFPFTVLSSNLLSLCYVFFPGIASSMVGRDCCIFGASFWWFRRVKCGGKNPLGSGHNQVVEGLDLYDGDG